MKKRTGGAGAVLVAVISIILLAAAAWLGAGAVKKRGLEKGTAALAILNARRSFRWAATRPC